MEACWVGKPNSLRLTPLSLATLLQVARLLANRGETIRAKDLVQRPLLHPAAWHQTRVEAPALAKVLELVDYPVIEPDDALRETLVDLIETL